MQRNPGKSGSHLKEFGKKICHSDSNVFFMSFFPEPQKTTIHEEFLSGLLEYLMEGIFTYSFQDICTVLQTSNTFSGDHMKQ